MSKKEFNTIIMYVIFIIYFFIQPIDLLLSRYITGTQYTHLSGVVVLMLSILTIFNINNKPIFKLKLNLQFLASVAFFIIILIQITYFFTLKNKSISGVYDIYSNFVKVVTCNIILLWVIGHYAVFFEVIFQRRAVKITTYMIYLIFAFVIVFMTIRNSGFSLDITKMSIMGHDVKIVDERFDYLSFSDKFALASLFIISTIKNKYLKVLSGLLCGLLLTLTLSRTSLYVYVLIIFVICIRYFINSKKKLLIISVILVLSLITLFKLRDGLMTSSFISQNNRMGVLLYDYQSDGSYQGRQMLKTLGEEIIRDNWFFGKFFYEVENDGKSGDYIHNIESYWAEYGFVVFILVLSQSAYLLLRISICFFKKKENDTLNFISYYTFFIIISLYLSRSYYAPYVWFVLSSGYKYLNMIHIPVNPSS